MKCFYPEAHGGHAPVWYVADGCVRPCPEVPARAQAIAHALSAAPGMEIVGPGRIDVWPALRGVHAEDYLDYLRTIHEVWSAEFGACDVLPDTFFPPGRPVRRPTKPAAQAGYYCFDMAAPIGAETWRAALDSAACACAAARALVTGERAAYALCRPPGHHAGPAYCGGFCFLNNAGIAAQHLLLAGKKSVAILDVDYHHGNGTQDMFYDRADVLFVSIHADPDAQYPYFRGHGDETGEGAGSGCNVNLPLARGAGTEAWLEALERALERIADFGPEALVVSLGVDTAASDGVGDFQLEAADFARVGRRLTSLGLATAFVQEGGYNVRQIGESVRSVLSGFEGAAGG